MKIEFPIIIYLDGDFTPDRGDFFKFVGARFLCDEKFSKKENRVRDMKAGWIIDYSGAFIELHPVGKSKERWRLIASLFWNLVKSEYSVTQPRQVTVGEIAERVAAFPRREPARSLATDFRRFLATEDQDAYISKELLMRWPL